VRTTGKWIGGARVNGTIVCAVNEFDSADAAVQVGAWLADRLGARIVLVSVAERFDSEIGSGLTVRQAQQGAQRLLERIAADHGLAGRCDLRVEVGTQSDVLAAVAAEEAAELIVLGAQGGFRRGTLRNEHARELAATATCPVVVAPPESGVTTAGLTPVFRER
jgi:nucleotide-binding universal stress UspA family protein